MDNNISLFTKIISVFWEPTKTFEAISKKIRALDIIIPIILLSIVSWITIPMITPVSIRTQKAKIEQSERIPEEKKQEIIEKMDEKKNSVMGYIISPIAITISIIILAVFLWFVGNFLLGGDRKFVDLWGVVSYSALIDIIASAVKIPLMVQKNSMEVYTSLGIFFSDTSTFLFRFMKYIDIFSLWKVIIFSIGLSVLYKKKLSKVLVIMFVAWMIYCLLAATVSGLIKF